MAAYTSDRSTVTRADIIAAVRELQWVEYGARPQAQPAETRVPAPTATPEPGAAMARLLVASDGRTVQEVTLRIGRLIVGRTPDNDLQIDSRFISRHHCQVITTAHSCVIEDLNSTNGIYVKSNRVRRHHLNDGDVVLIGKHELIYVDERAARGRGGIGETVPRLDAEGEEPQKAPAQRTVPTLGPAATGGQVPTVEEAAPLK
jgi:hypothetical protein